MATVLRFQQAATGEGRRWLVGVLVSSRCSDVGTALASVHGAGLDARVEVVGAFSAEVPRQMASLFRALCDKPPPPATALPELRRRLAELEAAVVAELLAQLGVAPSHVLAMGVHDPGLWSFSRHEPASYLSLCDAALLAESSGLNVVDAFPARDLARGGQGGPITALAEWLLLKDPDRGRLLLDLGRTARLSYLPAAVAQDAPCRVLSFEVGPGMALLDCLAERLTGGQDRFDMGGTLAVQGRRIDELIEHWLGDPYFDRPLPRWHPRGVRPERFLGEALQMAVQHGWSVRDLLCSATHFVARTVELAIRRRLPEDARFEEIVVTGGGQKNGLLLREIAQSTKLPMVHSADLPVPSEALGPASIAVLAQLYLDQVPANSTAITKTEVPRLLGRLTPGSPQSWRRLLHAIAESSPAIRPLRSAI